MSEASCPNFQPRAHAGLTGLTSKTSFRSHCARLINWPTLRCYSATRVARRPVHEIAWARRAQHLKLTYICLGTPSFVVKTTNRSKRDVDVLTYCQTSKTRVRAWLEIRTGRSAASASSRQGARSASEMQSSPACQVHAASRRPA